MAKINVDMQIIASTGAIVEQMSVDEAYLDISSICQVEDADASLRKAVPLARELKARIRSKRPLTATIGIAANKLLAKIASDHKKPDGLTLIPEDGKVPFLRPLPVRAFYGVGRVTEHERKLMRPLSQDLCQRIIAARANGVRAPAKCAAGLGSAVKVGSVLEAASAYRRMPKGYSPAIASI